MSSFLSPSSRCCGWWDGITLSCTPIDSTTLQISKRKFSTRWLDKIFVSTSNDNPKRRVDTRLKEEVTGTTTVSSRFLSSNFSVYSKRVLEWRNVPMSPHGWPISHYLYILVNYGSIWSTHCNLHDPAIWRTPRTSSIVSAVPSAKSSIKEGDRVLEINGVKYTDFKTEKKANDLFDMMVLDVVPGDDDDDSDDE
jgi:hypothetical protein